MTELRSANWFRGDDLYAFIHRSWMKSEGFPADVFDGRPVIGICNSWSELNNCNAHLRLVAEASSAACGRRAACRSSSPPSRSASRS